MPRYTQLVEQLPSTVPFVGPETQERNSGKQFRTRLGANESIFGPSPRAMAAMAQAGTECWKYGDPENHDLKQALAAHCNVGPENIVIGEGIDGLLGLLVRLMVGEGDKVVTSLGAYPTFNFHVSGFGGELITVPYVDDAEDPQSLLDAAIKSQAKLIYFSNPDNPMGSWHDAATVQSLIDDVPDGSLLCLDEAYGEFAPDGVLPEIDVNDERVIRMRTFSKAYGMAGVRIGYAIAHESLATAFNKVRNHFGVNKIGQAGAIAALADSEWLEHVKSEVALAKTRISDIAIENGLKPLPSATNFVTVDCGAGVEFAQALVKELGYLGVFVRMPFVAPQNRCMRISAGMPEDLDILEECLPKALKSVRDNLS